MRKMKNKELYIIPLIYSLFAPAPAYAHGEQIVIFLGSLVLFSVLSLTILVLLKIQNKIKCHTIAVYIIVLLLLLFVPVSIVMPETIRISEFLERIIWDHPGKTGFIINFIALAISLILNFVYKKSKIKPTKIIE